MSKLYNFQSTTFKLETILLKDKYNFCYNLFLIKNKIRFPLKIEKSFAIQMQQIGLHSLTSTYYINYNQIHTKLE